MGHISAKALSQDPKLLLMYCPPSSIPGPECVSFLLVGHQPNILNYIYGILSTSYECNRWPVLSHLRCYPFFGRSGFLRRQSYEDRDIGRSCRVHCAWGCGAKRVVRFRERPCQPPGTIQPDGGRDHGEFVQERPRWILR